MDMLFEIYVERLARYYGEAEKEVIEKANKELEEIETKLIAVLKEKFPMRTWWEITQNKIENINEILE